MHAKFGGHGGVGFSERVALCRDGGYVEVSRSQLRRSAVYVARGFNPWTTTNQRASPGRGDVWGQAPRLRGGHNRDGARHLGLKPQAIKTWLPTGASAGEWFGLFDERRCTSNSTHMLPRFFRSLSAYAGTA